MTNAEFRRRLKALGWDNTSLAAHLRIQRSSVQRWSNGAYTVPEHVAAWVKELSDLAAAGDDKNYNRVLEALPHGWQGATNNVRNNESRPDHD